MAIRRDVFAAVPGEGRWDCALLADGNIGIGGHPERLLRRLGRIVRPGGHVVVELDADGTDVVHHRWRLRVGSRVTPVVRLGGGRARRDRADGPRHRLRRRGPDHERRAARRRPATGGLTMRLPTVTDVEKRIPRPDAVHEHRAGATHDRPSRRLGRDPVRGVLPDRSLEPLAVHVAGLAADRPEPVRSVPRHAGTARRIWNRDHPAAAGQAVVGLPEAVHPSADASDQVGGDRRTGAGVDPRADGVRPVPAGQRHAQHRPVVPVGLQLPGHSRGGRVRRDRQHPRPRRRQAPRHRRRVVGWTGRRRCVAWLRRAEPTGSAGRQPGRRPRSRCC